MEKLIWKGALAPDDFFGPPTVRITADTEEHGRKSWDKFIWHLMNTPLQSLLKDYSKERELVIFHSGANIQLLSANNPNALAGDGVSLYLVDEAQYLTQAAWDNLFPSTSERNGVIVLFGVSEGTGPFRDLCTMGDDPSKPEFKRLVYPTSSNPFVPKQRIAFAERTLAPVKFKQLYMAEWEGALGKLFRNIESCVNPKPIQEHPKGWFFTEPWKPGHVYYAGFDLGRLSDWSVYSIWNSWGELVAWDRFSIIDWEVQKARAKALSDAYKGPSTVVDATGIGDPIYDDLAKMGFTVSDGYAITSNVRKRVLVDELVIRVGAGDISFPDIPVLIDELKAFEAKKSSTPGSTVVLYEASGGKHDDFVLSSALAMRVVPRRVSVIPLSDPELQEYGRQKGVWEDM